VNRYLVTFSRIGHIGQGHRQGFEARTVEGLEGPITEFVNNVLKKGAATADVTVTIDPELMKGQLNYGLLGNFTIAA
jgi:hypothetical protein